RRAAVERARSAGRRRCQLRVQLEDLTVMHTGEANHRAGLRDERRRCLTSGRPRLLITGVLDVPLDLESPVLHVTRGVPERLEGNANLDLEAPRGHASLRLPQKVRTEIVLTRHDVGARDEATRLA